MKNPTEERNKTKKKKELQKNKNQKKIHYSLILAILLFVRSHNELMIFRIHDLWLDNAQTVTIQGFFCSWLRNIEKKNITCTIDASLY